MRRLLLIALIVAGCAAEEPAAPAPEPMADPHPVSLQPRGDGELVAAPVGEEPWASRRRMDIDQLDASLQQVIGLAWEDVQGRNQFVELAGTLGKPDYIDSTQEDLTVSLLFQKFLGDAARDVCARRSEGEADGSFEPLLMRHVQPTTTPEGDPEAIDANLQELLLRFHGQHIEPQSERMTPWRWLFTSAVHVTDDPVAGWRAVCVGLLTHPDFYSY